MAEINLKNLIGVIQEFCYSRGYEFKLTYFSQQFSYEIQYILDDKIINRDVFIQKLKKHKDFLSANDIKIEEFSRDIIIYISKSLGYISQQEYLYNIIIDFKNHVESSGYNIFEKGIYEEVGRSLLHAFIRPKGFREAQMGGGKSDLVIPSEETIIETKIWKGVQYFEDGILELCRYLKLENYKTGYYVIFDPLKNLTKIRKNEGDVFTRKIGQLKLNFVFISCKPTSPSLLGKMKRKAN